MADSERTARDIESDLPAGVSRRGFLQGAAASGLVIAVQWSRPELAAACLAPPRAASAFMPNAFVQITPDNWVVVIVKHLEMGQGTTTGIATIVAEELDADWARVRAEYAPSDPTLYNNLAWGPVQGTGGSTAMRAGYEQMRRAGAAARAMLVEAAAGTWRVPANEISVQNGTLAHKSSKRASFGEMALAAAKLPVPQNVTLKDPARFVLIGKEGGHRLDSHAKSTGAAIYTADIRLPGLLNAFVVRPPAFGARLRKLDTAAAKAVRGVTDVVQIPEGIAVVATSTWAAMRGCDALQADWDTSESDKLSSEALFTQYRALAQTSGATVEHGEHTADALAHATKAIEAIYEFPFLAHAAMEPMNCVVWMHDGQLETWAGHQSQTGDHKLAAEAAGLPLDKVKLHSLISGGSFGRRANPWADYVVEAVHVAKAIGWRAPVRVQATRESDLRAGLYRPQYVHAVKVGIDAQDAIAGWKHTIVGQSILAAAGMLKPDAVDRTSTEGVSPTAYAIPNMSVDLHSPVTSVRPSVVALCRAHPYRVRDGDHDRRARSRRGPRSRRLSIAATKTEAAARRGARARRTARGVGQAASRGSSARHRDSRVFPDVRRGGR